MLDNGHIFIVNGEEHHFSGFTEGVKADFRKWLIAKAEEEISAANKLLKSDMIAQHVSNISTFAFDWGGSLFLNSMKTLRGIAKLAQMLNAAASGKVQPVETFSELLLTKSGTEEESEFAKFITKIIEESIPKIKGTADPKAE